jgi:NAD(P) transhydrogenase subunit alpha
MPSLLALTGTLAAGEFDPVVGLVVFVLATFVGFEVITKVPSTLHTPLMSGSNAISGIILVGALLLTGTAESPLAVGLGTLAVTLATVNVVGGFVVTDRMLRMFGGGRKRSGPGSNPPGKKP